MSNKSNCQNKTAHPSLSSLHTDCHRSVSACCTLQQGNILPTSCVPRHLFYFICKNTNNAVTSANNCSMTILNCAMRALNWCSIAACWPPAGHFKIQQCACTCTGNMQSQWNGSKSYPVGCWCGEGPPWCWPVLCVGPQHKADQFTKTAPWNMRPWSLCSALQTW